MGISGEKEMEIIMKLKVLLERMKYRLQQGSLETEVSSVVYDTRKEIEPGACFICIAGAVFDGHEYAATAAEQGAVAIIAEHEIQVPDTVSVVVVDNSRIALALISAAFFDYPAEKLKLVGITGTKGKTTTANMIREALCLTGHKTGLIGTIENIIGEEHIPASHSTPESYILQEYFAKMVNEGTEYAVMEVSSQGLKLNRVAGIIFDIGVFTNLEPDHISPNEHPNFDDYLYCKSLLFRQCRLGIANLDDEHFREMFRLSTCSTVTYGLSSEADYYAENINLHQEKGSAGIEFDVGGRLILHAIVDIPGRFNVYNSLAAIAVCHELGLDSGIIKKALSLIKVKGRVEPVKVCERFSILLDYAHNAMSLRSLLSTLKEYHPKRLVCMFGCGGNRSKDRRFEMGEISSNLADLTVITSDNPRYEEPEDIISDILTGVKRGPGKYITIIDRREAIRYCLSNAQDGDLIVIAGKGHEDYQEIRGVKYPMDDRIMIQEAAHEIHLC